MKHMTPILCSVMNRRFLGNGRRKKFCIPCQGNNTYKGKHGGMPTKTAPGVGRLQEFLGNEGRRQWTGGAGGEAAKLGRCQIVKSPLYYAKSCIWTWLWSRKNYLQIIKCLLCNRWHHRYLTFIILFKLQVKYKVDRYQFGFIVMEIKGSTEKIVQTGFEWRSTGLKFRILLHHILEEIGLS